MRHLLIFGFPGKLEVLEIHQYAWQDSFLVRYRDHNTDIIESISSKELFDLDVIELCRKVKMDVEEVSHKKEVQDQYCELRDDIIETLKVLEIQLWNLLQIARCRGGTPGYKVGGKWEVIRKMREFMKQNL